MGSLDFWKLFRSLKCISFKKVENNYEDQVGSSFEKIIKLTTQLVDPCADSLCFSGPPVLWQLRENPFAVLGGVKVREVHLPWVSNYFPPHLFPLNLALTWRFQKGLLDKSPVYEIPFRETFYWTGQLVVFRVQPRREVISHPP